MDTFLFNELLAKITPHISRKDTVMRDSISAHDRLCVTLRFLASGCSYKDLMFAFRISVPAISKLVPKVCRALYKTLQKEYLSIPSTRNQWIQLADEFESKWQFPHAVGAIDGKHISIRAPPHTGTEYFNYKKYFSIVLLGIVDSNAQFIAFDLGSAGSQSDGGIFKSGCLNDICASSCFPTPTQLGERITDVPYFLLGDDAFGLDIHLMKPYQHRSAMGDEKVYNYRHSRARRIVENAFGILCARFRVLLRTLELNVENAMEVVRACLALHNFLITKKDKNYMPPGFIDSEDCDGNVTPGSWRNLSNNSTEICDLRGDQSGRPSSTEARELRDTLKEFFYDEGAVSFQWDMTD